MSAAEVDILVGILLVAGLVWIGALISGGRR